MKKFLILILIALFSFGVLQLLISKNIISIPQNDTTDLDQNVEEITEKEESFKPLMPETKKVDSDDIKNKIALLRSRFSLK